MDLSPEEQSFFDTGDALSGPPQAADQAPHRRRSRRHSRRGFSHRVRTKLGGRGWRKAALSLILTIGTVGIGYWLSTYMINRDLPSPSEFGVQPRGR